MIMNKNKSIKPEIRIFPTPFDLAESFGLELVNMVMETGKNNSTFNLAVSGGNTPGLLFNILGDHFASAADWGHVHFYWVDERCVPPEDKESNFGMTRDTFLGKINIPPANLHRMRGEDDPEKESVRYGQELKMISSKRNGLPCFNMTLLGLGEDGHTASIFKGNEELFSSRRMCTTTVHPVTGQKRITITGNVINNSENIIFLVTGRNKSVVVKNILDQKDQSIRYPASLVSPVDGKLFWYIDREAAALLGS